MNNIQKALKHISGQVEHSYGEHFLGGSIYQDNQVFDDPSLSIVSSAFSSISDQNYRDFVLNNVMHQRIPASGTAISSVIGRRGHFTTASSSYRHNQTCVNYGISQHYSLQLIFKNAVNNLPNKAFLERAVKYADLQDALKPLQKDKKAQRELFNSAATPNLRHVLLLNYDISGSSHIRSSMGPEEWTRLMKDTANIAHSCAASNNGAILRSEGDGAVLMFAATDYTDNETSALLQNQVFNFVNEFTKRFEALKTKQRNSPLQNTHIRFALSASPITTYILNVQNKLQDYYGDGLLINQRLSDALPRSHNVFGLDSSVAQIQDVKADRALPYTHFKPATAQLIAL